MIPKSITINGQPNLLLKVILGEGGKFFLFTCSLSRRGSETGKGRPRGSHPRYYARRPLEYERFALPAILSERRERKEGVHILGGVLQSRSGEPPSRKSGCREDRPRLKSRTHGISQTFRERVGR